MRESGGSGARSSATRRNERPPARRSHPSTGSWPSAAGAVLPRPAPETTRPPRSTDAAEEGGKMEIGKPRRVHIVEPLEHPVPSKRPRPARTPEPERERTPEPRTPEKPAAK